MINWSAKWVGKMLRQTVTLSRDPEHIEICGALGLNPPDDYGSFWPHDKPNEIWVEKGLGQTVVILSHNR